MKEQYFYLDSTPSHSYMRMLYKYPQAEFPYRQLLEENQKRGREQGELELVDLGVFQENRYFDVFIEYAKSDWEDILIRITAHNRGPEAAELHVLPTLWFRNTWSLGEGFAAADSAQGRGHADGGLRGGRALAIWQEMAVGRGQTGNAVYRKRNELR